MTRKNIFVLVRYGPSLKPHVLDSYMTYEAAEEGRNVALQQYLEHGLPELSVEIQHSTYYNV